MKAFSCIAFLILLSTSFSYAQDIFKETFKEKWAHQQKYLLECLEMLEEKDLTYKPVSDEMSLRDLVLHMSSNMLWLSRDYMQGGSYQPLFENKDLSKDQLIQHVKSIFEYSTKASQDFNTHQLKTKVDFFAGEKSMLQIFELMDDHLTHHKGQLTVYMRLCGKKPPRYVGW